MFKRAVKWTKTSPIRFKNIIYFLSNTIIQLIIQPKELIIQPKECSKVLLKPRLKGERRDKDFTPPWTMMNIFSSMDPQPPLLSNSLSKPGHWKTPPRTSRLWNWNWNLNNGTANNKDSYKSCRLSNWRPSNSKPSLR